jgi:hypothetical protein
LGDVIHEGGSKSTGKDHDYQAQPIEKSSNSAQSGQKKDPYVIRATERAKIKTRNRIFELNGGHVH